MLSLLRLSAISLLVACPVYAGDKAAATAAAPTGSAVVTANPLTVLLGLFAIVGLILLLAWLARRLNGVSTFNNSGTMRVVSSLAVGPRERVMVIDVAGEQFLIGVAQGSVNGIHHFSDPVIQANTTRGGFQKTLAQMLKSRAAGVDAGNAQGDK